MDLQKFHLYDLLSRSAYKFQHQFYGSLLKRKLNYNRIFGMGFVIINKIMPQRGKCQLNEMVKIWLDRRKLIKYWLLYKI
jgi:hypothetical protein